MPLPSRRQPEELRAALQRWFRRAQPDATVGPVSIPEGNGMSSETLLFELTTEGGTDALVARLRPDMDDWPVFPAYDLGKQAAAMRIVGAHTDVPVPVVRAFEPDADVVGAPFLVMERRPGTALPDLPPYTFGGSFLDGMTDAERAEYQRNFMSVLARIHRIELTPEEAASIAPIHGDALRRQLDGVRSYYEWVRGDLSVDLIERGIEWLERNKPADPGPTVLNWGDSRPGNALAAGTEQTGILDWEMVDLGPAAVDVGWAIFFHSFFQRLAEGYGFPGFPGLFDPQQALADYTAAGGHQVDDLEWYMTLASVRYAVISIRIVQREVAYGNAVAPENPEDLIHHRAQLEEQLSA